MAHFSKIDENNKVVQVVVVSNEITTPDGVNESEQLGIDFLVSLYSSGTFKQTSYNNNIRKNYAGIGYTYDENRDSFIEPQPYPSWTLVEDTCQWTSPVVKPDDGKNYEWDEDTTNWTEIEMPL